MSADGEPAAKPTLLQDLLCGAMHSRAAYGYAMAAGHLSSLLNFALLQTVRACRRGAPTGVVAMCRSDSRVGMKACSETAECWMENELSGTWFVACLSVVQAFAQQGR